MIFSSIPFIFAFLPIALCGYYLLGAIGRRLAAGWLVAASLVFYAYWNPSYLILLLGSIAWNFSMGSWVFGIKSDAGNRKLYVLWAASAGNLVLLGFYKYLFPTIGFLAAHHLVPAEWESDVILPLGISFFTFTQIGYLVDSYGGTAKERGLLSYMLFVTFYRHRLRQPLVGHRLAELLRHILKRNRLYVGRS
jgi:alginate O-acetyltransferase complex protein AlgI